MVIDSDTVYRPTGAINSFPLRRRHRGVTPAITSTPADAGSKTTPHEQQECDDLLDLFFSPLQSRLIHIPLFGFLNEKIKMKNVVNAKRQRAFDPREFEKCISHHIILYIGTASTSQRSGFYPPPPPPVSPAYSHRLDFKVINIITI